MTVRLSKSLQSFGDLAIGNAENVILSFVGKYPPSSLSENVVVIGQSVKSFFESLPCNSDMKATLGDILPDSGSSPKGWSGATTSRFEGKKTRMHVFMTPTEASRHNNPFRADSFTKTLMSQFPEMILDASKTSDSRVSVVCTLPSLAAVSSVSFGIARALPRFTRKTDRGKDADTTKPPVEVEVSYFLESGESIPKETLESISTVADSIRMSQALTDSPPNELNVTSYTQFIQTLAEKLQDVSVKIIQGRELESQGFGGIWNVGKGNTTNPPAMIVLSHRNHQSKSSSNKSVVLVGKGIIYDTGGLSIKPRDGMCGMKNDMTGSASMFAAFVALVRTGGLPTGEDLHCILCLAENSVGPDSFRNDDIVRLYSGLTVEINNTDAEGRLVLADGCAYAAKHLYPRLVIDMATLTGAQGIATGQLHAAVVSAYEEDETAIVNAGKRSGDLVFPILFCPEFHRPNYKSDVADMKNSVSNRADAVSSASGWFMYEHMNACGFTGNWVHVDMASPATFGSAGRGSGYGVALICALLGNL